MSSARGFTLLEIMAVVVIVGLTTALVLPRVAALRGNALRNEARLLAAHLEHARQSAVMTGDPYRVVLDLDQNGYWLEVALPPDAHASDDFETGGPPPSAISAGGLLDLSPPRAEGAAIFERVQGNQGRVAWLREGFEIEGLETIEGWVEGGVFAVAFDPDGATDGLSIVIGDGETIGYVLEVNPLLASVRIRDDDA